MKNTATIVKISLIAILLICLLRMPFGYYQFVRIAGCVGFAYLLWSDDKIIFKIIWIGAIILLNPIMKIIIHKHKWNIIDVILATLLIFSVIINKKEAK